MNFYVVVEGSATEREVYREWIPLVNTSLSFVEHPSMLTENTFAIVSGFGYPFYKRIIINAIEDVEVMQNATRLVVCVDSEEMEADEKYQEISAVITNQPAGNLDFRIVIQHFCFETWALGNRKLKGPASEQLLLELRRHYDVSMLDPEGLPPYGKLRLNRSQLANLYLMKLLNNKRKGMTYSKSSPGMVCHPKYFDQVKNRFLDTMHIQSFSSFLTAFG